MSEFQIGDPNLFSVGKGFKSNTYYEKEASLLPIRFQKLDPDRYVVTNIAGEHVLLSPKQLTQLITEQTCSDPKLKSDLIGKHFLAEGNSKAHLDLLSAKVRTRYSLLTEFTSLHLFITTLRCDHSCQYCQVSRVSADRAAFDMTEETASKAIEMMLRSPSKHLKVEFQGGESLLNFDVIRYVITEVEARKGQRNVQYVFATNLVPLNDEILEFAELYPIYFSTSLDGPNWLHNQNRPRPGKNSHAMSVAGIEKIRARLGNDRISALMTTSAASLEHPEAIIDEYVRLGFHEIFLRHISPYGFAVKTAHKTGYETETFLNFFKRGLSHVIRLNKEGIFFREVYSSLLLRRILTPFPDGYVDLQSPAGMGQMVMAYNYNGEVYSSDEGRMLAEMGDTTFRLGNLQHNSYEEMILERGLIESLHSTMIEAVPQCEECAFQNWCGTDPVFHHRTQGDLVGHRPTSAFCRRNMEVIKHLLRLLEEPETASILRSWI